MEQFLWDDLVMETAPKKEEPKPVREVREVKVKVEKPKDDQTERLRQRIRELERTIELQNNEIAEKTERIHELEQQNNELSNADKRNLQFLVNCVAKTYKIEFRKNRAPAVKLALTNIIEKFGLNVPDEME